jgi:hypothetical protein
MQFSSEFEQMHEKIVKDRVKKDEKYGCREEDFVIKSQVCVILLIERF